jgi:hypothetical protein
MSKRFAVVIAALALAGCGSSKKDSERGLPPADDWQAPQASPSSSNPGADPHAGLNMGGANDPHAGLNMGGANDPHAGLNMGGPDDPHAGLDMGGANAGLPGAPPDPNRTIDPSKFLRGRIEATEKTAGMVKSGAVLFISVRPVEPTTGEVMGAPLAVDRIDISSLPVPFELTEANMMVAGTQFQGDVAVIARVDSDGDAMSKSPGDIEGRVQAKIPAGDLVLKLDTVLQ